MKNNVVATLALLPVLLAGCAAAPGQKMDKTPPQIDGVRYRPITPELVAELSSRSPRRVPRLETPDLEEYQYRVGPHDILTITVWDHPELTIPAGAFRSAEAAGHLIAEDGTIFYPYAGTLRVAGLTVGEIRRLITRRISAKIVDPQVDVRVAQFRSQRAYIVGEVREPGPYAITDMPLTVIEAVNLAGGITLEADLQNLTISRDGELYPVDLLALYEQGDVSQNYLLRDGDVLQIPDRNLQKVFILGEVATPQSQLIYRGRLTLAEALGDAGGFDNTSANPAQIFVIRGTPDEAEIFHLNARSPGALILGDQFQLQARDVVYVEAAPIVRWNRLVTQIVPTARVLNDASDINFPLFSGGADD